MCSGCMNQRISYVSMEIKNDTPDELFVSCKLITSSWSAKRGDKKEDKVIIPPNSNKTMKLAYNFNHTTGFNVQTAKPGTEIPSFHFHTPGKQDPWGVHEYKGQLTAEKYYITIKKSAGTSYGYLYQISVN